MRFQHIAGTFLPPADLLYIGGDESGHPQMVMIGVLQLL
jgi:hypothetical protein